MEESQSPTVSCPRCSGEHTKKAGFTQGTRQYFCHDCQRYWKHGHVKGIRITCLCIVCGTAMSLPYKQRGKKCCSEACRTIIKARTNAALSQTKKHRMRSAIIARRTITEKSRYRGLVLPQDNPERKTEIIAFSFAIARRRALNGHRTKRAHKLSTALKCPRCESRHTKKSGSNGQGKAIAYCHACDRYWTIGAPLRLPSAPCPGCGGMHTARKGSSHGRKMLYCHDCQRYLIIEGQSQVKIQESPHE